MTSQNPQLEEMVNIAQRAKKCFSQNPLISKIDSFGSIKSGTFDKYSDIDLVIQVQEGLSMVKLKKIVGEINEYYVILPISNTPEEIVCTVIWKNLSFYHKMDLRIIATHPDIRLEAIQSNESDKLFWDFYIGVIRYAKYRKRKMHWTASKFFRSSIEMWARQKLFRITGTLNKSKLTSEDYLHLDQLELVRKVWLYPCSENQMDLAVRQMAHEFGILVAGNSLSSKSGFLPHIIKFLDNELK